MSAGRERSSCAMRASAAARRSMAAAATSSSRATPTPRFYPARPHAMDAGSTDSPAHPEAHLTGQFDALH